MVELVSDLAPLTKPLIAAVRRCSSSIARRLLRLRKRTRPPAIEAIPIMPTTTPTAMPTLEPPPPPLLFEPDVDVDAAAVTVTTFPD